MHRQQFLLQCYPTYMHLAQIMEEKTDLEKEEFGKVTLSAGSHHEDQISYLTRVYLEELKEPLELLTQCV